MSVRSRLARLLSPLNISESIETRMLLYCNIPKIRKGVKEEMNGGESEKKGEEGFEICETRENTLP